MSSKTGIEVPDTGIRDENGLEPMDNLFSSPAKPKEPSTRKVNGAHKNTNTTISSEEEMDVDESMLLSYNSRYVNIDSAQALFLNLQTSSSNESEQISDYPRHVQNPRSKLF